jgi:hypothetical protein
LKKDWYDFKSKYGNIEGARSAFELACETLFRKENAGKNVQQVAVKQGDGGIDVFIGEISTSPITVIQCKFFLDEIGDSQKNQITNSFKKIILSEVFKVNKWILCVPRTLTLDENIWWDRWVNKQSELHALNKDMFQVISGNELIDRMKSSDVYNSVFDITDSLTIQDINEKLKKVLDLLITKNKIENQKLISRGANTNSILFYNYTREVESFYFERSIDLNFCEKLDVAHLWISGKSGSGKTVFINRNLNVHKKKYLFCDLSPIIICKADDVFTEIYYELCEYLNAKAETPTNLIKQITGLLLKINTSFTIVVDELSITEDQILAELTDKVVRLINFYSNKSDSKELRFVMSTIKIPNTSVENRNKTAEYFDFIETSNWNEDLTNLLNFLLPELKIKLNDSQKDFVIQNSRDSPRLLKNILKKLTLHEAIDENLLKEVVFKAIQEFI